MIKFIDILDGSFEFDLNFDNGSYNLITFKDENLRFKLIRSVLEMCKNDFEIYPYVISGFNLKPYLDTKDNIYSSFGIDLREKCDEVLLFENYCSVFGFTNHDVDFDLLSRFDKLRSMFMVALFTDSRVILFDNCYSEDFRCCANRIVDLVRSHSLFSQGVFIEIRKED